MQTLKTAAIVVLLMTVLYGAYVSMTTPPDPLPQGVESMLVESGLDDFPDDFEDFGIDSGTLEDLTPPRTVASGEAGSNATDPNNNAMNFGAVDEAFADAGPSESGDVRAASFQLSDLDGSQTSVNKNARASRLPDVGNTASTPIKLDPEKDYPSTGSDYQLPDPAGDLQADSSKKTSRDADLAAAGLANAIATADRQYESDRRREALATLSLFYETPNLTSEQREELLIRLDPLAREVIYSPEHLLEQPHRVSGSETLMDVAQEYDVPWQLLANINGIEDPVTVLPGTDLKVLRGPFRADVDLGNQELTLFLGDLYAGRFPIGLGSDPVPRAGSYTIQEKNSAKTYYDLSGNPVPPGNPRNPYGAMWIDLGSGICLHGSPKSDKPTDQGCISVAGNYSRDVFGILSEGSSVTIR